MCCFRADLVTGVDTELEGWKNNSSHENISQVWVLLNFLYRCLQKKATKKQSHTWTSSPKRTELHEDLNSFRLSQVPMRERPTHPKHNQQAGIYSFITHCKKRACILCRTSWRRSFAAAHVERQKAFSAVGYCHPAMTSCVSQVAAQNAAPCVWSQSLPYGWCSHVMCVSKCVLQQAWSRTEPASICAKWRRSENMSPIPSL
jgi:hypothetical protein